MNKKWNEKSTFEKTVDIISGVAFCVWFIFEVLADKSKIVFAETISYIALFIVCICEAISFWNTKRVISYIAIGGIVLTLAALVLLAL